MTGIRLVSNESTLITAEGRGVGLEAEQSLLGALLLDGTAIARVNGLRPEHFAADEHRRIFAAILDQAEDGEIDLVTVGERLRRNGAADQHIFVYLGGLAQNTPSAAHVARYGELVKEQARRRELTALGQELAERAAAPGADAIALRCEAEARLARIGSADKGPAPLDLMALAKLEPQRPQFIIQDWLPAGYATLLAGHGGVGKSAIALHLGVCAALGEAFFGLPVERRRVLYMSCEDRADVLHWRLARICAYRGIGMASLAGWLNIFDLVGGRDALLWDRDPRTGYVLAPGYGLLQEQMRRHQAELLIVDGVADAFGGNENARSDVKRFVNAILALVPTTGAALLIAHVAKPAAAAPNTGEGYSGSTQWHNAARARWYLYPETANGDEDERPERTGRLMLELQKSNLGRAEGSLAFRWDDDAHLFLAEQVGTSVFDRRQQERDERQGILRAFQACAAAIPPIFVPAALQGPRTVLHVLSACPEFPETLRASKPAARRFRRMLEELRQSRAIEETEYRRTNRHHATQLSLTAEGVRQCAV